ncbi:hypothetical protein EJ377_01540 [Chryseobacterium arthrosphaerae]|uniref:Carboxypeptidase regulatory-like domain-containing protein n=1 Tax=Chryseobacterium arthrosphaerae TaxID=651561 RepID=A0A432DYR9_9FLAO|nr:hypothetical protein EJ377_01540 [Chryseobacterium arthrosphaerae]
MAKITAAFYIFLFSILKSFCRGSLYFGNSFNKYSFQVQQKGNVSGRIVNAQGKPLANVQLQLTG